MDDAQELIDDYLSSTPGTVTPSGFSKYNNFKDSIVEACLRQKVIAITMGWLFDLLDEPHREKLAVVDKTLHAFKIERRSEVFWSWIKNDSYYAICSEFPQRDVVAAKYLTVDSITRAMTFDQLAKLIVKFDRLVMVGGPFYTASASPMFGGSSGSMFVTGHLAAQMYGSATMQAVPVPVMADNTLVVQKVLQVMRDKKYGSARLL